MIFTERTITVVNDSATINKPLILYRGDKNIELKITIAESQFKFRNTDASNVIETTDASYAQLVINTPYNSPIFSDVAATKNGAVIFVITEAMIDEIREVGAYEIQIRLLDDNKQSRASIPPVSNAIEIREPIAIEDGSAVDSNAVNTARVNRALTTTSAPLEAFDSQGNYIKNNWGDGDPITDAALNKMEAGIDGVNKKIGNVRSQIKDKVNKGDRELHVGINQEFTSIQSAINNVTPEKNVIIVHEGQYKEKLALNEMNVTIKGVDKDLVTIWNDAGRYGNDPLLIRGGNVKISDISILSKYEDIGEDNGCYALHIDRSEDSSSNYSPSKVIIENCNITSYNHAGAGCGTENNQTIQFINCNISSYKNAGLLYHTSIVNMENQKFSVVNCNIFSDTFFPLFIKNDTPNSSGFEVEFINNNLVGNNPYTQGTGSEKNILNALTKNSYGNNDKKINYNSPKQMYQLTSDDGTCMEVTDLNNATLCGFYTADPTKDGLNCPTSDAVYIVQTISYSTTGFLVQYAWAITGSNMYKKYKRGKDANVWSSWAEVSE